VKDNTKSRQKLPFPLADSSTIDSGLTAAEAARALRVSIPTLKQLCARGALASYRTPGGHLRISARAVEDYRNPMKPTRSDRAPCGVIQNRREHVEELNLEAQEVRAKRELAKLRREDEEERHQAEQQLELAEQERRDLDERARAERQEQATRQARERRRRAWETKWFEFAAKSLPGGVPNEIKFFVQRAVRERLSECAPDESDRVVETLVLSACEEALEPWKRRNEIEEIIEVAQRELPPQVRSLRLGTRYDPPLTEWEALAKQEARKVIGGLRPGSSRAEVQAAALQATRRIVGQYEQRELEKAHRDSMEVLLTWVYGDEARDAVRSALELLPIGCGRAQMERIRNKVLAPILEKQRAAEEAKRKEAQATSDTDRLLWHVHVYIEERCRHDPRNFYERYLLSEKIKQKIRPKMIQQFLGGELDEDEARDFVEEAVDEMW